MAMIKSCFGVFMNLYQKLLNPEKYFIIAGPCVVEEEDMMMAVAEKLKKETTHRNIPFIFKSSFRKANRTSIESPSGPGLEKGLAILNKIKEKFDLPILTDIHDVSEIPKASEVADILQIPAFLCRQTDLIVSAAETGKIINIKKGQFMAPEDMKNAAQKVASTGNRNILLTERGTSFGYHNLVVDFRGFAIMKQFGYPVVYDVTHSLQKPSLDKISGGTPEYALMMAKAALATGMVNGLFVETHPDPQNALSDADSMLSLDNIPGFLDECLKLY
jgi:2-dehydro-3-deoxyphosphooctonate aldolase (KDO 8-P synthase)